MPAHRHDDWSQLIGAHVQIRRDYETVRWGVVDDAMTNSSAVWLMADGEHGRKVYAKAEGYEIWIEPRELDGKFAYRMTNSALGYPHDSASVTLDVETKNER